ncbi:uncharacterized protein LOC124932781 isoform X2 [Impatiens glandulifera]|uniref:uncharacterized protein LOC124932781 isoform X2 n=1 Tax=Impatiens glandulifera TaxID=253017 RepID=UPI001FB0A550|nr:uncharacterized protein LOC124932781 isoform X2 [Impatiens glandulifera]
MERTGSPENTVVAEACRPLPYLYLSSTLIWFFVAFVWALNTCRNRHFQSNNLQWTLTLIPLVKALQLGLSFLFWYSCSNFHICSLWLSFGVYTTGVLSQTVSFISFLLISHGYCIMYERLSVSERRNATTLGCVFYLTLVGYRTSVPYSSVFLLVNYLLSFYLIFRNVSRNLVTLREQMAFIEDENVLGMRDAICTKYALFKKFQGAMQVVVIAEIAIFINKDNSLDIFWLRVLAREWAQVCIFIYIGWMFRSQELAPNFSVIPHLKRREPTVVPPIYSIEMGAEQFKDFRNHEWHIGVPTSCSLDKNGEAPILVIVQNPSGHRHNTVSPGSTNAAKSCSHLHSI